MPLYSYRCQHCNEVSEEVHAMSSYPKDIVCHEDDCPGTAHIVILSTPFFSIDKESEVFNVGLGQAFRNKQHRLDYMKSKTRTEWNPIEQRETLVTLREVESCEVEADRQYLNDVKQAKADGAAPPVHPDITRKRRIEGDILKKKLAKARPAATRDLATREA